MHNARWPPWPRLQNQRLFPVPLPTISAPTPRQDSHKIATHQGSIMDIPSKHSRFYLFNLRHTQLKLYCPLEARLHLISYLLQHLKEYNSVTGKLQAKGRRSHFTSPSFPSFFHFSSGESDSACSLELLWGIKVAVHVNLHLVSQQWWIWGWEC